jgi:hypothetical protein
MVSTTRNMRRTVKRNKDGGVDLTSLFRRRTIFALIFAHNFNNNYRGQPSEAPT